MSQELENKVTELKARIFDLQEQANTEIERLSDFIREIAVRSQFDTSNGIDIEKLLNHIGSAFPEDADEVEEVVEDKPKRGKKA